MENTELRQLIQKSGHKWGKPRMNNDGRKLFRASITCSCLGLTLSTPRMDESRCQTFRNGTEDKSTLCETAKNRASVGQPSNSRSSDHRRRSGSAGLSAIS